MYTNVNVNISDSQKQKLKKALTSGRELTIRLTIWSALASRLLPALGVGALSSLAGDGLYIKKGGHVCELETYGKRVLLKPESGKMFMKLGDGLYLKKEGRLYDGRGLLLGPNSPFRNIPILGMLL